MNMFLDKVEDCYYHIDEAKHVYFNGSNDDFIRDLAENTDWDFKKLGTPDSRFDLDCDPTQAIELVPDWGSSICLFSIGQERQYDFVTRLNRPTDNFINEFFVKPGDSDNVMINELVDMVCNYYRHHACKTLLYYHDRYGDSSKPNVKNAKSYNEQAIDCFHKRGWTVIARMHRGMEPPQHDKYLLWGNILKGSDPKFPAVRFNGQKCKYTLISMNNTQVIEKEGKFTKNKKSEYSKSILPEVATHFSDAVDKRIWTKYGNLLRKGGSFVPARY
jgi:hypothetical protein